MRSLLFLLLPLFLLLAPADAADWPENQTHYFIIRPGDEWVLDVTLTDPEGKEVKSTVRRRIGEEVERNGRTYFRVYDERMKPTPVQHHYLRRRDFLGVYSLDEEDENAEEQPDAILPLQPGQTWSAKDNDGALTIKVIGLETVKVGEKTYPNCIHLRFTHWNGDIGDQWEAPEVGPVQYIGRKINGAKGTFTLRGFTPARPSEAKPAEAKPAEVK